MGVKKVGSRVLVLILYVFSLVLLSNIVFGACPGVLGVDYTEYQCNGYNQQCPSCRSCERKDEFTVNTIQYVPDCSVCGYPGQNFLEDTYIDNCDSYDLLKRYKPGEDRCGNLLEVVSCSLEIEGGKCVSLNGWPEQTFYENRLKAFCAPASCNVDNVDDTFCAKGTFPVICKEGTPVYSWTDNSENACCSNGNYFGVGAPECQTETICRDSVDNDGDDLIDCQDPTNCADDSLCVECTADADCQGEEVCRPDGFCGTGCDSTGDGTECPAGLICRDDGEGDPNTGYCENCASNVDCPAEGICLEGGCEDCSGNGECNLNCPFDVDCCVNDDNICSEGCSGKEDIDCCVNDDDQCTEGCTTENDNDCCVSGDNICSEGCSGEKDTDCCINDDDQCTEGCTPENDNDCTEEDNYEYKTTGDFSLCYDNKDNDGDGLIDENDPDCAFSLVIQDKVNVIRKDDKKNIIYEQLFPVSIYYGVDPIIYNERKIIEYTKRKFYPNSKEYRIVTEYDPLLSQVDVKIKFNHVPAPKKFDIIELNINNHQDTKCFDDNKDPFLKHCQWYDSQGAKGKRGQKLDDLLVIKADPEKRALVSSDASSPVGVAKYVTYFGVLNANPLLYLNVAKKNYNFYYVLSALDGYSPEKPKHLGKAIYFIKKVKGSAGFEDWALRGALTNGINRLSKRIIRVYGGLQSSFDTKVLLAGASKTSNFAYYLRSGAILLKRTAPKNTLSHEMGHRFSNLCEEYSTRVGGNVKSTLAFSALGCPNSWPSCCSKHGSKEEGDDFIPKVGTKNCVYLDFDVLTCAGMPYILGARDDANFVYNPEIYKMSVMSNHFITPLIYPGGSTCPLKGCI